MKPVILHVWLMNRVAKLLATNIIYGCISRFLGTIFGEPIASSLADTMLTIILYILAKDMEVKNNDNSNEPSELTGRLGRRLYSSALLDHCRGQITPTDRDSSTPPVS